MTGEIAKVVDHGARVTKDRSSGWPLHREGRAKSRGVPRSTPVGDWWLGEEGKVVAQRLPPHRGHKWFVWALGSKKCRSVDLSDQAVSVIQGTFFKRRRIFCLPRPRNCCTCLNT